MNHQCERSGPTDTWLKHFGSVKRKQKSTCNIGGTRFMRLNLKEDL